MSVPARTFPDHGERTTAGHRLAEPLTFEIACSAGPHPATIETDWSVTFPFDWESERVVCALAGVSHSCEHLEVQVGSVAQTALLRLHASRTRSGSSAPVSGRSAHG